MGKLVRVLDLKFQIFVFLGLLPHRKLLRLGLHTAWLQYARRNTVDWAASLLRLGVRTFAGSVMLYGSI